ncbi:MAG: GTP 3',8-cyclase MoaA [Phycisphaeraceae bacterium]|jgi:cyclic pyranopterin phosphate synthase|nr:GTP 3',8-cyclase MoaA [Phycisphaeraceae bacterium]
MTVTTALPILDVSPQRPVYAQGPRNLGAVQLLRISVTDRCNFRCVYCMPEDGVAYTHREDLLGVGDIVAVAQAARSAGVTHFKITGGEPTVRHDVVQICRAIAALEPDDLSLTTNGMLLDSLAAPLRDAGVDRLTVSWDTMQPLRFTQLARGGAKTMGGLDQLRRGLDAAAAAGFDRLKINTVVMGGLNDDEVVDFARLTLDKPWTVRFIEYMPLGDSSLGDDADAYIVDNERIAQTIEHAMGRLTPVSRETEPGVGPANVFYLPDAAGRVGFISAMSRPFCETCNRLRLTAMGQLRACLFDGGEVDIMPALRPCPNVPRLVELMRECVAQKPEVHSDHGNRAMSQIGG